MNLPEIRLSPLPRNFHFEVHPVADPHFSVRNDASGATISIFDAIGTELVNAATIRAALDQIGPRPVVLEINSPGGDAFVGVTIFNLLRKHPAPVKAEILGLAASAASILAMGASRIEMAKNSEMMIHNASLWAAGPVSVMRQAVDILERMDASLAETYAARSGQPVDEIARLMEKTTFLSASEAIDLGLADTLLPRDALPRPQVRNENAPTSKRDLESRLRSVGLSKSEAARATAAAWRRHEGDDEPDLERVAASLDANYQNIKSLLQRGARIHAGH